MSEIPPLLLIADGARTRGWTHAAWLSGGVPISRGCADLEVPARRRADRRAASRESAYRHVVQRRRHRSRRSPPASRRRAAVASDDDRRSAAMNRPRCRRDCLDDRLSKRRDVDVRARTGSDGRPAASLSISTTVPDRRSRAVVSLETDQSLKLLRRNGGVNLTSSTRRRIRGREEP